MKSCFIALTLFCVVIPTNAQHQGITGKVEWVSGNQMPGPGKQYAKPIGIQREIWIYQAVSVIDTKSEGVFFSEINVELIKKVITRPNGKFKVKLPPGEYSLFIKEGNGLFANQFDSQNRINYVNVQRGKFAEFNIRVDYEAAY